MPAKRYGDEYIPLIKSLIERGQLSHREIAEHLGCSQSFVSKIASVGNGSGYSKPRPTKGPARCHTCGGRVYLPCQLCAMRKRNAEKPISIHRKGDPDILSMSISELLEECDELSNTGNDYHRENTKLVILLNQNGYYTVKDLLYTTQQRLLTLPQFGRNSLRKILEALKAKGIS